MQDTVEDRYDVDKLMIESLVHSIHNEEVNKLIIIIAFRKLKMIIIVDSYIHPEAVLLSELLDDIEQINDFNKLLA